MRLAEPAMLSAGVSIDRRDQSLDQVWFWICIRAAQGAHQFIGGLHPTSINAKPTGQLGVVDGGARQIEHLLCDGPGTSRANALQFQEEDGVGVVPDQHGGDVAAPPVTVSQSWRGAFAVAAANPAPSAAPLAVSGVLLAAALPALLIGPFAGVLVDRWPKQRTMRLMDALRAVLVCSLLPISGPFPLPLAVKLTIIYLVVAAVSGLSQFFTPATKAILKEVVPEEQPTLASALTVGAGVFAWTIGSACAGLCYVSLGAGWAMAVNAASFACSWMLVGRMRVSAAERRASTQPTSLRRGLTELREGLRFIQGQLQLRTLLLTQSLYSFGWGIVSVLAFFYITQNIHVPMSLFGLWMAVTAIGASWEPCSLIVR